MKIVYMFLYLYLLLRPYYFFESGGLQISDFFLMISFIFLFFFNNKSIKLSINQNKHFLIFTLFVSIVNSFYFIFHKNTGFLYSILYVIFNFIGVLVFNNCYKDKNFLKTVSNIFKINLIIQLVIFLVGLGRNYDAFRYMGLFNDPNQFGYYILISYIFIYVIKIILKDNKRDILYLIISTFLIFESASTGMLLGIFVFIIMRLLISFKSITLSIKSNSFKIGRIFLFSSLAIILSFLIIESNPSYKLKIDNIINNFEIFNRAKDKITVMESDKFSIFEERGYDKLYLYPKYMLYGAGEGYDERFTLTYHQSEVHATFPSILFYYGLIPLIIILLWVFKNLKALPISLLIAYVAILFESFTLLNQRQVLFWALILLGSTYKYYKEAENENITCN